MTILARLSLAAALALSPLGLAAQGQNPSQETHATGPERGPEAQSHGQEAAPQAEPEQAEGHKAGAHEEAEGHHGPAMKLFGKAYGNGPAFLVQLLNFAIYAAGLFFVLKGALSAIFKTRKVELETLLSQAERDKAEADAQMKELEAKMAGLEGELAGILAKAESDAEVEKQRVIEAAKAEAEQILAQAQTEIGNQKRLAEQELRALVAELAVEGAATRLEAKLTGAEAAKALDRAIQKIGQQTGGVQS
jgi:F-type H+-transporting ATPase subunit b